MIEVVDNIIHDVMGFTRWALDEGFFSDDIIMRRKPSTTASIDDDEETSPRAGGIMWEARSA